MSEDIIDAEVIGDSDKGTALAPAQQGPRLLMAGTFAMYEHPDGGAVVVWSDAVTGEEQRRKLPRSLFRIATGEGGPFGKKLRQILGVTDAEESAISQLSSGDSRELATGKAEKKGRKNARRLD